MASPTFFGKVFLSKYISDLTVRVVNALSPVPWKYCQTSITRTLHNRYTLMIGTKLRHRYVSAS